VGVWGLNYQVSARYLTHANLEGLALYTRVSTVPCFYPHMRIMYIMLNRVFGHTVVHRGKLTHRHRSKKREVPLPYFEGRLTRLIAAEVADKLMVF